jgi:hypothetical protein
MIIFKHIRKTFARGVIALLPFGATAQSMHITAGANLILTTNVAMKLNNISLVNDGNLAAAHSTNLYFTGTNALSIGGSSPTTFDNLLLSMGGGYVTLNQSININGNLGLNGGNVDLNGHILNLGATGNLFNEWDMAQVVDNSGGGKVTVTRPVMANTAINPGNIGAELLIPGTSGSNLGNYTIDRSYLSSSIGSQQSILRSYAISNGTGSLPAGITYRLRFSYMGSILDGDDPSQLRLWAYNNPSGAFVMLGADSNNLYKWLEKDGIAQLGLFTLCPDPTGGITLPGGNSVKSTGSSINPNSPAITFSVRAYPNPAHDQFTLELLSPSEKQVQVCLYDRAGHLLRQKEIYCTTGTNHVDWDLSGYAAGAYYLSVKGTATKNIVVIRK